jgi:hypothetical protein
MLSVVVCGRLSIFLLVLSSDSPRGSVLAEFAWVYDGTRTNGLFAP